MFGFGSQKQRKAKQEVGALLRRLLNLSDPRISQGFEELRESSRCLRCVPVVVVPCDDNDLPIANQATFGTTKELSDHGLAVVLPVEMSADQVIVGILAEGEPRFMRGEVKHCTHIGGDLWQLGVDVFELLDLYTPGVRNLLPFGLHLAPAQEAELGQLG